MYYYKDKDNNYFAFKTELWREILPTKKVLNKETNQIEEITEQYTTEELENKENYIQITEEEWNEHISQIQVIEESINVNWQKEIRINELKSLLASTDYQAIKFAEGAISSEEFEPIRTQRQAWRNEINELEAE